jgi:hypothetical protein
MKWPTELRASQARTFPRTCADEKAICARDKCRHGDTNGGAVTRPLRQRQRENRFTVPAHDVGENDFVARYIRNSISLTMPRSRRMICVSRQRGE